MARRATAQTLHYNREDDSWGPSVAMTRYSGTTRYKPKRKSSKRKKKVAARKRRKSTTTTKRRTPTMAKRRRRRKSTPTTRRGKLARKMSTKRRRKGSVRRRRRTAGAGVKRTRRRSSRPTVRIRRRSKGRRGGASFNSKNVVGMIKQAAVDGAWVTVGDVAANMAKIMLGQTGIMGNVVQVGGGIAAGFLITKQFGKDAGRMAMAGAAAGLVRAIVQDNLLPTIPASTFKTNLTAALQGYPHSDYMATINGYPNAGQTVTANGMPTGQFGVFQG